jgi:hypothetical protein
VSERTSVAFVDLGSAVQGVAIAGAGTLIVRDGELTAAGAPQLDGWSLRVPGSAELTLEPLAPPAESVAQSARIWLCSASGSVAGVAFDGLAALTRVLAAPAALERSISILFDPTLAFVLTASAPGETGGHGEERLEAAVFRGEPLAAAPIERPRLSTTYDATGLPRHAGIELWESADADFALRIGGEVVTNGQLAGPGDARTSVAFLAWHGDSHHAVGAYTITTAG